MIETSLPRAGRVTLRRQEEQRRTILHLLYATPALRGNLEGDTVQVIQDLPTLRGISVSVEAGRAVKSVRLVPENIMLDFKDEAGRIIFEVPSVQGHQMVELCDYEGS